MPTPLLQNITLYPYVNPPTELIDAHRPAAASLDVTPIASRGRRDADLEDHAQRRGHPPDPLPPLRRAGDQPGHVGQHHHPARATELGWKDTVRISPLEDTIVALRPIVPDASVRGPDSDASAQPDDAVGARAIDTAGLEAGSTTSTPRATRSDADHQPVINFGWEYVFHCHILSHEEMDMMRPVTVHVARYCPQHPS